MSVQITIASTSQATRTPAHPTGDDCIHYPASPHGTPTGPSVHDHRQLPPTRRHDHLDLRHQPPSVTTVPTAPPAVAFPYPRSPNSPHLKLHPPHHDTVAAMSPPPSSSGPRREMSRNALILVIHSFTSFVICSLDRINISVAIIPMSALYGWSKSTQGLIQSIFFAGYMLTMVPGGRLADRRGGRPVLAVGVLVWSLATLLIPPSATLALWLLLLCRVVLGAGEGVAMPSMNAMISRHVPTHYRARSLAFIYSGMYMGSIVGLLITPSLLNAYGWQSAFYVYGVVGIVWVALFLLTTNDDVNSIAVAHEDETTKLNTSTPPDTSELDAQAAPIGFEEAQQQRCFPDSDSSEAVTGRGSDSSTLGREPSVFETFCHWGSVSLYVGQFCCTWGYFVLVAWLPTYLYSEFSLDLSSSSLLSTLPWISMFLFSNVGGYLADYLLLNTSLQLTTIRKINQGIGFLGPSVFLLVLMVSRPTLPVALGCIALTLATSAFSQSGVYANHQDIGPHCSGMLLGVSSTIASIPGLVGVYLSGLALQLFDNDWNYVFGMSLFFYAFGFVFYTIFGTARRIW